MSGNVLNGGDKVKDICEENGEKESLNKTVHGTAEYCEGCGSCGGNADTMDDRIERLKEKLYNKNLSPAEAKHTMRQLTRMEKMVHRRKTEGSKVKQEDSSPV